MKAAVYVGGLIAPRKWCLIYMLSSIIFDILFEAMTSFNSALSWKLETNAFRAPEPDLKNEFFFIREFYNFTI